MVNNINSNACFWAEHAECAKRINFQLVPKYAHVIHNLEVDHAVAIYHNLGYILEQLAALHPMLLE